MSIFDADYDEVDRRIKHEYYLRNKERIKTNSKAYKKTHPEKCREWCKKYDMTHDRTEYKKKYYQENKERLKAQQKAYRERKKAERNKNDR